MEIIDRNGDPRIKIVGLLVLTWAHAVAKEWGILVLTLVTISVIIIYWEFFLRYLSVIAITVILLCVLSIFAWITTQEISLPSLLLNLLKWLSMSSVTLTLFSSLNALEFIVALRWLKVPNRIALALGISLRFFPVIVEQGARILIIQRLRQGANLRQGIVHRFNKTVQGVIPAMFVSILRQVENITLSVLVQDIEQRVSSYRIPSLNKFDFLLFILLNLFPGLLIVLSLNPI